MLAKRLEDVQRHEAGLPQADPVHDMRVATRRLRATLRLLDLRELDAPVKKLQDALGEVRDLQLQIEWLAGRDDALRARRSKELPAAQRRLEAAVRAWRERTLPRLLGEDPSAPSPKKIRKIIGKRLDRFEERLESALARGSPAAMHAIRRSVKQVRYLLEQTRSELGAPAKSLLADLTPLQESLGQLHDVDVRISLIRRGPLLRDEREARGQLASIVTAQLERWKKKKLVRTARRAL